MANGLLFNPDVYDPRHFDPETRRQLRALIEWFEGRGKAKLLQDDADAVWVSDFLDFIKRERIFATFLTPAE
jgi:acyl-CoA dehydrogenase